MSTKIKNNKKKKPITIEGYTAIAIKESKQFREMRYFMKTDELFKTSMPSAKVNKCKLIIYED
jgi:hypothetical protein